MEALEILREPFHAGTRVTNCITHLSLPFSDRPDDCKLCSTDVKSHLAYAIRVNEFLNSKVDRAVAALMEE